MIDTRPDVNPSSNTRSTLGEIAKLFLKLGTIAFGGPAAHIAMMEDEVVRRRRWLTEEEFLDILGATNLIPGPNSTEMAIHIGYRRARLPGLIVAGVCFIFPAVIIVGMIAWAYVRYGNLPVSAAILYDIKPVIIAIIVQALWRLGATALKTKLLVTVGLLATIAALGGVNELVILFSAAILVLIVRSRSTNTQNSSLVSLVLPLPIIGSTTATTTATTLAATPVGLLPLFLIFLKIGSVLFGSGYVLLAFLRADFVDRLGWLTETQLLDAVAVGQITPGPVFTTATFIGYILAGPKGAALATVGIFLPAFIFVALSAPFISKLRRSPTAASILDGLNVSSLALMAVVTFHLARAAIVDVPTVALTILSAVLLIRFRWGATWLIVAGGIVGVVASHMSLTT